MRLMMEDDSRSTFGLTVDLSARAAQSNIWKTDYLNDWRAGDDTHVQIEMTLIAADEDGIQKAIVEACLVTAYRFGNMDFTSLERRIKDMLDNWIIARKLAIVPISTGSGSGLILTARRGIVLE